jgi:hypothetical protein
MTDKRPGRSTRKFDSGKLAALTKKEAPPTPRLTEAETPTISRSVTIEDPMTMQLLAEVVKRSQTVDFDEKVIDELVESLDEPAVVTDTPRNRHPNTRNRSR